MRMVRADEYKLIYYPVGNRFQLFDLEKDPRELKDLAGQSEYSKIRSRLTGILKEELYGSDLEWIEDGELIGLPDRGFRPGPDRGLGDQRGWRY